jgi:hypothetical protein
MLGQQFLSTVFNLSLATSITVTVLSLGLEPYARSGACATPPYLAGACDDRSQRC